MTPQPHDLSKNSSPRIRSGAFTRGNVSASPRSVRPYELAGDRSYPAPVPSPLPMQSLIASAKRLTEKKLKSGTFKKSAAAGWQEDAWEMYDLVGEQHFLGSTLANQASKAVFYVGILGEGADTTDAPEPAEDQELQSVLDAVGGGPSGFSQLVQRLCVNLWVAGDGWLVGIPRQLMPDFEPEEGEALEDYALPSLQDVQNPDLDVDLSMSDLEWRMMSVSEVSLQRDGKVKLHLGGEASEKIETSPDLLYMIRVWRPHPRRSWEADSPTRSSLPVLRELVGLTMHISAQVDSRLAGAGILLVPASAARAMKIASGIPEDSPEDPFTDALIESMVTPIGDRANASAVVPLVLTVPDGTSKEFDFLTFAKPLDTEARNLREEAIRRLALGQDAPPELLLGTAGMNHWGAWLVRDDVVTTHIEPPLALIADALTTQYLRPMMAELGYTEEQIKKHVVWYDVSTMIARPNKAADALTLYDRDVLSDEALRAASGFDETDAPETSKMDLASQKAFLMVQENPGLMANPGLPVLVDQMRALIAGAPVPLPDKVKKEAAEASVPVDANGKPIVVTNPTGNPNARPAAPAAGQPAPSAPSPATTPTRPTAGTPATSRTPAGAPPHNPSAAQPGGPAGARPTGAAAADVDESMVFAGGWSVPEGQAYSTLPTASSLGAIVVLIPEEGDPIYEAADGIVHPHLTLAYLSNDLDLEPVDEPIRHSIFDQVRQAASVACKRQVDLADLTDTDSVSEQPKITLPVDSIQPLGPSIVALVRPDAAGDLEFLHEDLTDVATPVGVLDGERNRYQDQPFTPHVSLTYNDDEDENGEALFVVNYFASDTITFDRIGVWIGEEHWDFPLGEFAMGVEPTYSRVDMGFGFGPKIPVVTAKRGGLSYTAEDFADTVIDTFEELQKQHD